MNFVRIPTAAIYPLYTSLFTSIDGADRTKVTSTGQNSIVTAGLITIGVIMLLAMLLVTPLFVRKYVVRISKSLTVYTNTDFAHIATETDEQRCGSVGCERPPKDR